MMTSAKPGVVPSIMDDPHADPFTQPFWSAALEGRVTAEECTECGLRLLPATPRCYRCQNNKFRTVDLPGTGSIYSFIVVRHPLRPSLKEVVPYVSAVVELDGTQGEGARMVVNVIDCDPDKVAIGDRVRIVFDKVSDTFAVPRAVPQR
jgi:uncharacterized OB-fold protein